MATSLAALCLLAIVPGAPAQAATSPVELKLSLGGSWQSSNDVQIPNNAAGTRFSLQDIAGSGPLPAVRLESIWNINDRHALRVLLAPLSYRETGTIDEPINFAGETFSADQSIQAEYRFNSWRAGYRYHLVARDQWDMWLGGTLKVRDAEIKLTQGATVSSDDDLGIIPLLHVAGVYRFGGAWSVAADLDGLAGGPGRAIDLGVSINYEPSSRWRMGLEYRTLEGGADIDDLYNFAWFNSLLLTVQHRR